MVSSELRVICSRCLLAAPPAAGASAGFAQPPSSGLRLVPGGTISSMRSSSAVVEHDVRRGELALEVLHGARADDRRGDRGVVSTNAIASSISVMPGLVGELRELRRPRRACAGCRAATGRSAAGSRSARVESGLLGALAPAAGQPAARQRAHGITPMPYARRSAGRRPRSPRTRIEYGGCSLTKRCRRRSRADPLRLDDLRRRERRGADVADLALLDEVGERAERLVDVGLRVGAVDLVEVDPVGAEPPQRVLDLPDDPAARVAAAVGVVAHRHVDLGREDDVVAAAA